MAVNAATLRQDIFGVLRTLMIANKPTYTYNSQTFTYTILSAFPDNDSSFPCIILNKALIKLTLLNLDGTGEDYEVEVKIDFYTKEAHGKAAIDAGQDNLCNTFVGNISLFNTDNYLLPAENFWDDSNTTEIMQNNQLLNTAGSIVRFIVR